MDPLSSELEICRACLAIGVKLFDIVNTDLGELLTEITKTPVTSNDGLSRFVCYICRSKLSHFADFQSKCHQALKTLYDFKTRGFETIDKDLINSKLTSNYTFSKIQLIYTKGLDLVVENEDSVYLTNLNNETATIKTENEFQLIKTNETDLKTVVIEDDIKINKKEYDQDSIGEDNAFDSASELTIKDEKDVKEVKKKKVEKSVRAKKKASKEKSGEKKKFNRYNEKFQEDFAEFANQYSLEVVFLSSEQQLERFRRRVLEDKYKLKCAHCGLGFKTATALQKHDKMHDPSSGEFRCEVCLCRYPSKGAFMRHARGHKKEFRCTLCDKVLCNSNRAKMHHLWHKGFQPECKLCNKKFNIHSSYLNHVREQHAPARCKLCAARPFRGTLALHAHRDLAHATCTSCQIQFKSYEALVVHNTKRCSDDDKPCVSCGLHFPDDVALETHAKVHDRSSQDTASSYLCELCAKSFSSSINLRTHQSNVHSALRPHACPHCPKAFADRTKLQGHINTHTGERPYQCKQCPEMFKSYAQRYKHKMRVHSKERPHKCRLCEKAYVLSNDLKWHVRYAHLHEPRPPRARRRPAPAAGAAPVAGAGAGVGAPLA